MVDEQKMFQDKKSLEKEEKKALEEKAEEKPAQKEEAKKESEKKDEKEIKKRVIVLQRAYTVPLVGAYAKTKYKRGDVAVKMLREYVQKHMKSGVVKISTEANNFIRQRGSARPLKKVSVMASKDKDGLTTVELKK